METGRGGGSQKEVHRERQRSPRRQRLLPTAISIIKDSFSTPSCLMPSPLPGAGTERNTQCGYAICKFLLQLKLRSRDSILVLMSSDTSKYKRPGGLSPRFCGPPKTDSKKNEV